MTLWKINTHLNRGSKIVNLCQRDVLSQSKTWKMSSLWSYKPSLPSARYRHSLCDCALLSKESSYQQRLHYYSHRNLMTYWRRPISFSTRFRINYRGAKPTELYEAIINGDRSALAYAITLVESTLPQKRKSSEEILSLTLKHMRMANEQWKKTFRIGLTGPPGSGKSTLIEILGLHLTSKSHKVAVLAVDPSSARTGGSLLGDRTRMTQLSTEPNAYIRPSPSAGTLGGVTRSTNEAILLCEGAGYDVILVETVGVGQSEFAVADMVDMFVLLIPPAGGDELQGIKKGIVEVADLILINKADGELMAAANKIQAEYISALKLLHNANPLWAPEVMKISALTNRGIQEAWDKMLEYHVIMTKSGTQERRRKEQYKIWMWNHIRDRIMDRFRTHPRVKAKVGEMEDLVAKEIITPGMAADRLMTIFVND